MSLTRSSLFAATGLIALAAGLGPVSAADDGYQNVVSSVLTAVGVMKPDDASAEIDYRERPALVLPPKDDLVTPVAPGAGRPTSWPQDPDVLKRRKAAEEARAPSLNLLGNPNALLSRDELMKGRTASTPASAARASQCGNNGNGRGCLVVSPEELKAESEHYAASGGGSDNNKDVQPGDEPDRLWLTQPPKGYMRVSKMVKATHEAPKSQIDESLPSAALVYRPKKDDDE